MLLLSPQKFTLSPRLPQNLTPVGRGVTRRRPTELNQDATLFPREYGRGCSRVSCNLWTHVSNVTRTWPRVQGSILITGKLNDDGKVFISSEALIRTDGHEKVKDGRYAERHEMWTTGRAFRHGDSALRRHCVLSTGHDSCKWPTGAVQWELEQFWGPCAEPSHSD
jgi:hypothetical protein